jgi:hypothetical protein
LYALLLGLIASPASAQFTPFPGSPRTILEGHWQSCREGEGRDVHYTERVYDHLVNGVGQFEVHLGPRHEFAIFTGVQDEHRDHRSPDNLLMPFDVPMQGNKANYRWEIPSLKLIFTVSLAGGSRTDCESWFIVLEPMDKTS